MKHIFIHQAFSCGRFGQRMYSLKRKKLWQNQLEMSIFPAKNLHLGEKLERTEEKNFPRAKRGWKMKRGKNKDRGADTIQKLKISTKITQLTSNTTLL